jgi:TFIIF-interacting CTD phosphatase-like protein
VIEQYLRELDELISASPEVIDVQIIRRSVWDTELEKVALYRYRLKMSDRSLLELTERLVEEKGTLSIKRYRHHWQSYDGQVIKRWDNAPHHPEIDTFPHHLHDGSESNVIGHGEIAGLNALRIVISLIVNDNK